jgi:hypothetical protein
MFYVEAVTVIIQIAGKHILKRRIFLMAPILKKQMVNHSNLKPKLRTPSGSNSDKKDSRMIIKRRKSSMLVILL